MCNRNSLLVQGTKKSRVSMHNQVGESEASLCVLWWMVIPRMGVSGPFCPFAEGSCSRIGNVGKLSSDKETSVVSKELLEIRA